MPARDDLTSMRQSLLDHAAQRRAQLESGHLGLDDLLLGGVDGGLLELHVQHRVAHPSDHLALDDPTALVDQQFGDLAGRLGRQGDLVDLDGA